MKSILGSKWKLAQNVMTKNAFTPFIFGLNNLFKRKINGCSKGISLGKLFKTFYGKNNLFFLVSLQIFVFLWY